MCFTLTGRSAKDKVILHKEYSQGLLSNSKFPQQKFTLDVRLDRKNSYS